MTPLKCARQICTRHLAHPEPPRFAIQVTPHKCARQTYARHLAHPKLRPFRVFSTGANNKGCMSGTSFLKEHSQHLLYGITHKVRAKSCLEQAQAA